MGRRVVVILLLLVLAGGTVGAATSWAEPAYNLAITTHFTATNEARSASTVLTLNHDGPATIKASVAAPGDEVLTGAGADTLTTSYKLTGAALGGSADTNWVSSSTFISPEKSYSVEGTGPSNLTLSVRGQSAANRANNAGTYSATVILTVTW